MNLSTALEAFFLARDFTPKSRQWYASKLDIFVRWVAQQQGVDDIAQLEAAHIRRFVEHLRQTPTKRTPGSRVEQALSSNTLHGYMRAIKSFLHWCVREDLVSEKLPRRLEMPKREIKVVQPFTRAHIGVLYKKAGEVDDHYPWLAARDQAIIAILTDTGIRANELCDLTLDRVFLTAEDAYLVVNGKGRKQREVGLGRLSRQQLHRYIHRYRPHQPGERHVFLTRSHAPLQPEGLDRMLYRLRDKAGIEDVRVSAHTFRHSYACQYLANGGDIYKLSRLLGHTSVVVTEGYLRAFEARDARRGESVWDKLRE